MYSLKWPKKIKSISQNGFSLNFNFETKQKKLNVTIIFPPTHVHTFLHISARKKREFIFVKLAVLRDFQ